MSVTSTTLAGINVWQFSGAVTDAEIKTAWSALIVNGRYQPGRYIYLDSTCDMRNVRGAINVDLQALGFILHQSRNRANTVLTNWFVFQTGALAQATRFNFVRATDGVSVLDAWGDGLSFKGGAFVYDVPGTSVNETRIADVDGTALMTGLPANTEFNPSITASGIWRAIVSQKATLIFDSVTKVFYRCAFNTEVSSAPAIRAYFANVCYISSIVRRNGAPVTTGTLGNTAYSNGTQSIMFLNNWKDESFFGESKTNLTFTDWNAGNRIIGGVLKKIQTQPGTLVNVYDSRSTAAPQKSTFSETTSDFLTGTTGTTTDASTGKATFVVVGAIATGASIAVTRYTGQQYTLQKFGYRVMVQSVDMSMGDDDLSAFAPITMTAQAGITRTQSAINAATSIDTIQQLLEELHVLAIGLTGSASYGGAYTGNLFDYAGSILTTAFASVTVDATATSKISYNAATNALTIKSTTLAGASAVGSWVNASGPIATANGAAITAVVEDSTGVRVTVTKSGGGTFNIAARKGTTGAYTDLGYQAGVSSVTYTVAKGTPVEVVAWSLGCVTYTRLIDTTAGGVALAMEMTPNAAINTALDVSSYLSNIVTSIDTSGAYPVFVVTINAPMTVPDIEVMKALVHRLVSSQVALSAGFPPGSVSILAINTDEITIAKPAIRIELGAGVTATQRVYLDAYFNQAPALALNPAWSLAPVRADGNQVQILRTKPSLDPGYLAAKVVAAMPAVPTAAQNATAVQAAIERTGGMLDSKASQASVTALGTPAQATALAALATANQTEHDATQAAIAALPAPANADIAAIKAKTDVLVNGPTLAQIEASTVLAKQATLTDLAATNLAEHNTTQAAIAAIPTAPVPPTASQIRAEIEADNGKLDKAMKYSKAAKRQTL